MGQIVSNMKNILSVDFDAILYPCIQLYNDKVIGSENPTVMWKILDRDIGIIEHIRYDANLLQSISSIMEDAVLNGSKFYAIETHDQIIDILREDEDFDKIDRGGNHINLVNIDFHHDILYSKESEDSIISYDEYTCADWVGYLKFHEYLNTYTWVHAANSSFPDPNLIKGLHFDTIPNKDIGKIKIPFDKVFFCLSPQWVPYQYHHLYDMIKNSCERIQKKVGGNK